MRLIYFIFLPFATFLQSFFDLEKRSAQIVIVLFFGLFGYCHTFEDTRADSYRKYESYTNYAAEDIEYIFDDFQDGRRKDVYESIIFSVTKQISDDPHVLMFIVGILGGVFYMLIAKRFYDDKKGRYTWPIIILTIFIIVESNLLQIGGIRNFMAFGVFMYSIIRLLIDDKKVWLIGLLLTPLIHFGYIIAVVAALIIWLIKIPNTLMHYFAVIICISSIFLNTSSYEGVLDMMMGNIENETIEGRVNSYGDEETEARFNQSLTTRLVKINNQIGALFITALLIYIKRNKSRLLSTQYTLKLYHYLLFFTIVSYSLISFSVVGQRFVYIAMVLLYMLLLNIYQNNPTSAISKFIYSMPFVFIIHILWTLYNCYCNTGLGIYFLPLPVLVL